MANGPNPQNSKLTFEKIQRVKGAYIVRKLRFFPRSLQVIFQTTY